MSLIKKIAHNTLYQVAGKIIGTIFGLITVGLMTRYLGQVGFGYYTSALAFIQFFAVLIDFGLQMTTAQLLGKPDQDEAKIFNAIFTFRIISAIVCLGASVGLVWLMPYPYIVKVGASIVSLSFLAITLQSVLISIFQKHLSLAKVAAAEVWGRVVLLLGTIIATTGALALEQGLIVMIIATVLGNVVSFGLLYFSAGRYIKIRLTWDPATLRQIWPIAWPVAVTIAMTLVYFRADTIILSLTRSAEEVGIYGATYRVLDIIIQLPYLFLGLLLPLMSQFFITRRDMFAQTVQHAFNFLMIIVLPLIGGTLMVGPALMTLVAGEEFRQSGEVLKVLIIAGGLIYLGALFGYAIVAAELQKKMIKYYSINALISFFLYITLIPIYSYWAAAWLTVLTELMIVLSSYWVLRRHAGVSPSLRIVPKAATATIAMMAVIYAIATTPLAVQIIIGILTYFTILYALRGIDRAHLREILTIRPTYVD